MGRIRNLWNAAVGKEPEPIYITVDEDEEEKKSKTKPRKPKKEDLFEAGQRHARETFDMVMSAQREGERRAEERMQKWIEMQNRSTIEQQMTSVDKMLEFGMSIAQRMQQPAGGGNEIAEIAKAVLPAVIQSEAGQDFLKGLTSKVAAPNPGTAVGSVTRPQSPVTNGATAKPATTTQARSNPAAQLNPYIFGFLRKFIPAMVQNADPTRLAQEIIALANIAGDDPDFVNQYNAIVHGNAEELLRQLAALKQDPGLVQIPHALNWTLKFQSLAAQAEKELREQLEALQNQSAVVAPTAIAPVEETEEYEDDEEEGEYLTAGANS